MTSKIINMAERMKDKDELRLEALFRSESIADDGFSQRVLRRLRRRMWVRRLVLPTALVVGGLVAFKPASELVAALFKLLDVLPKDLTAALPSASLLPQASTIMVGGALVVAALLFVRALED